MFLASKAQESYICAIDQLPMNGKHSAFEGVLFRLEIVIYNLLINIFVEDTKQ